MADHAPTIVWSAVLVVMAVIPWWLTRGDQLGQKLIAAASYLGLLVIAIWMLWAYRQPPWWPIPLGVLTGVMILVGLFDWLRNVRAHAGQHDASCRDATTHTDVNDRPLSGDAPGHVCD